MNDIRITIADVPDREACVVELWRGGVQIAEVRQEGTTDLIQFYPGPSLHLLEFDLSQLIQILESMKSLIRQPRKDSD